MSESTGNTSTPAGWYPDPAGSAQQRWWNGTEWTDHLSGLNAAPYQAAAYDERPPRVPEGTPVYNPFIWAIALLPILSLIALLTSPMAAYTPPALGQPPRVQPTDFILPIIGVLIFLISVLLAYFDWRTLQRTGYVRPFHWAWAFLSGAVYIIGRSVVVRRRAGHGLLPIWVWAAIMVIYLVVLVSRIIAEVSSVLNTIPGHTLNS